MSGKHLYIMLDDNNKLILKDNNSTNGTWKRLAQKRVQSQKCLIPDLCILRFGFNYKFVA